MPRRSKSWLARFVRVIAVTAMASVIWLLGYSYYEVEVSQSVQFSLQHGSSLRSATRQMQAAGILSFPLQFEILARLLGEAGRIQAGNYELSGAISHYRLLKKITSGAHSQDQITIIEGWTWLQVRAALDAHPTLRHESRGLTDAEIMQRIGGPGSTPEGWFFPDTYFFAAGDTDIRVLRRAYDMMNSQLTKAWNARASNLPLYNEYQALTLASIIEKETGRAEERPMIATVFINRLRAGMKLQTDPSVIYGMGASFDGNLRKVDLLKDGPYNSYTRSGLPPSPIAMPGLGSLTATVNPAPGNSLYFVSRGDGTSHFSSTLAEHERAVTKYQRRGGR